ncbi:MAG: hypothetical protein IKC84_03840 [Helicobacteraceae bacterium]|nr:hypothetical protein [Helicobacteraceae bacterium]
MILQKYNVLVESKSMQEMPTHRTLKIDPIHSNEAGHNMIAQTITTLIKDNK